MCITKYKGFAKLSDGSIVELIEGKSFKSVTIGNGLAYEELGISDFKSGIYIVKLTVNGQQIAAEKLVVK